ncbi:unnamed protein product [Diplocarpon coronariae]
MAIILILSIQQPSIARAADTITIAVPKDIMNEHSRRLGLLLKLDFDNAGPKSTSVAVICSEVHVDDLDQLLRAKSATNIDAVEHVEVEPGFGEQSKLDKSFICLEVSLELSIRQCTTLLNGMIMEGLVPAS